MSGAVQRVACCNVAPRPPQGVRDGQGNGEEMRVFKQITSLPYLVIFRQSVSSIFFFSSLATLSDLQCMERLKNRAAACTDSKGQVHK